MPNRQFTREQLATLGVPPDHPDDVQYSDTLLADEHVTVLKYSQQRRVILAAPDDGKTYAVQYEAPIDAGDFEVHGEGPDDYGWYGDTVEGVEVAQLPVMQWHAVDSSLARLHAVAKAANEGAPHVAMQAVRRVYELCREHDASTGLAPVSEVFNALGVSSDGDGLDELAPE